MWHVWARRKKPRGRSKLTWEFNIEIDITAMQWKAVDWIYLAEEGNSWRALVNTVMNLGVP